MDMYANGSSFGASLTLQNSNSFRDVSFSSYLNQTEEKMIQKITNDHHCPKKSEDDDELDVFGAENYFKEEAEDVESKIGRKFVDDYEFGSKVEEFDRINMHSPSVRSNVSCNSHVGLLPRSNQALGISESGDKTKTKTKTKTNFLARFGCNCINKKLTQISEKMLIQSKEISKPHTKMLDFDQKIKLAERKTGKDYFGLIQNIELTQRSASMGPHQKSEGPRYYRSRKSNDYFSFPVLNSNDLILKSNSDHSNLKSGNLTGKFDGNNNNSSSNSNSNGGRLSLGKKLSLLNDWNVDIPPEDELYNNDADSDSSSDLFEIESFSTTGNNSFIAPRESTCYNYIL
ncbi:uncharacterized protein LOC143554391 [Bidens hawaiensis]|uniref:uncharacterized protein LOC143554391 n=1 Tax=Bidens hawaiensis TaxID=980011 RepID=UPI0040498861